MTAKRRAHRGACLLLIACVMSPWMGCAGASSGAAEVAIILDASNDTVSQEQYEVVVAQAGQAAFSPEMESRLRRLGPEVHSLSTFSGERPLEYDVNDMDIVSAVFVGETLLLFATGDAVVLWDVINRARVAKATLDGTPVYVGPSRDSDFKVLDDDRRVWNGYLKGLDVVRDTDGALERSALWTNNGIRRREPQTDGSVSQ